MKELLSHKNIFLYGAGNLGRKLHKFLKSNGIEIKAFLDKRENALPIEGTKVINPFTNEIDTTNAIVIVSIFNRDIDFTVVKGQLLHIGFDEVISFLEFYPYCSDELGDWYWMSNNKEYLYDDKTLASVSDLLEDTLSKDIFASIINTRKSNNYELFPKKYPIEEQYFSKDIPLRKYTEFIDCGAYDGDTLDAMKDMNITCGKIYAFEPDLQNFQKLLDKVKKYHQQAVLFPCGVHSHTELLRFNSGAGEGSAISKEGVEIIQCVALDDVLIHTISEPAFLKMDIEGAELDALKGAENLIRNADIDLAICVYHKPMDIVEIPQLISTYGDYDFYLRLYGYYGMDLVLYALKKK